MLLKYLKPLIPAVAWVILLLIKPNFSFSSFFQEFFQLTPIEARSLDLVFIAAISTYLLMFIDIVIVFIKNVKPIYIKLHFEDIQNKHNSFTTLEEPDGRPRRVKLLISVNCKNKISYAILEKYFGPLIIEISWLSKWLVVELDNVNVVEYSKSNDKIHVNLSEIVGWPNGEAELKLAIATRHVQTKSSSISSNIVLGGNIMRILVKCFFIHHDCSKHMLRL